MQRGEQRCGVSHHALDSLGIKWTSLTFNFSAKRYERMMRAHGIHPNGGPGRAPTARQPKVERTAGPVPAKKPKSKAAAFEEENMNVDDEEEPLPFNGIKPETSQDEELLVVKNEDQEHLMFSGSNDLQEAHSEATPNLGMFSMADNGYESGNSGYGTPVAGAYDIGHLSSYTMGGSSEYGQSPQVPTRHNSPSEQASPFSAGPIVIAD